MVKQMAQRYPTSSVVPFWDWRSFGPPALGKPPANGYSWTEKKSKSKPKVHDRAHTIDVIGNGPETTICGHIDLLLLLPIHNSMHRKLLKTFRNKPGNYEGKYNSGGERKANVMDYGNGYLAIHFIDDITRPEMSDFLLAHGWRMMSAHCTTQGGRDVIYEKWTNVIDVKPEPDRQTGFNMPRRFY